MRGTDATPRHSHVLLLIHAHAHTQHDAPPQSRAGAGGRVAGTALYVTRGKEKLRLVYASSSSACSSPIVMISAR